jgi:F-type H+-transporting ATPase subunit b
MFAGFYVYINVKLPFQEDLAKQGIPLDIGKTIAVVGVFLILFPVLNSFFFKPLADAIQERSTELESTFSEAESLRTEMTKMRSDYEQRLVATEAAAREQIQGQIKEAQQLRQQLMAEATERADELVRRASQEIEQERQQVLTDLRAGVVTLALGATEKLLNENIDSEKNRRLVQEYIDQIEVKA